MKDQKDAIRLELEVFEMESLNVETLNIEELERRLELTSGLITAMDWLCGSLCTCYENICPTDCPIYCAPDCATYCSDCPTYCIDCIDCPTDVIVA